MKINEIILNPSQDDFPNSYEYHFKNPVDQHQLPLTPGYIFKAASDDMGFHMGIWHIDDIISYVGLHPEPFGWQVDKITTNQAHRSKGFIRYLIEYAAKKFQKIHSDYHQTPEAAGIWRALIKYRNNNHYYLYNVAANSLTGIKYDHSTNSYQPDPWDDSDQFVICAVHDSNRQQMTEQRIKFNQVRNRPHPMMGDNFREYNP